MSEEKQKKSAESAEPSIPLSDFKEMMAKLAQAIVDSRKPYVDPRQAENDELFRETSRAIEERKQAAVKADQATCPHLQGCNELSDKTGDLSSIAWHDLGNGIIFGLCTNCIRPFWPTDPDYVSQFKRKSGNKISGAGQRRFIVPQVAQTRPSVRTPVAGVDVPQPAEVPEPVAQ